MENNNVRAICKMTHVLIWHERPYCAVSSRNQIFRNIKIMVQPQYLLYFCPHHNPYIYLSNFSPTCSLNVMAINGSESKRKKNTPASVISTSILTSVSFRPMTSFCFGVSDLFCLSSSEKTASSSLEPLDSSLELRDSSLLLSAALQGKFKILVKIPKGH